MPSVKEANKSKRRRTTHRLLCDGTVRFNIGNHRLSHPGPRIATTNEAQGARPNLPLLVRSHGLVNVEPGWSPSRCHGLFSRFQQLKFFSGCKTIIQSFVHESDEFQREIMLLFMGSEIFTTVLQNTASRNLLSPYRSPSRVSDTAKQYTLSTDGSTSGNFLAAGNQGPVKGFKCLWRIGVDTPISDFMGLLQLWCAGVRVRNSYSVRVCGVSCHPILSTFWKPCPAKLAHQLVNKHVGSLMNRRGCLLYDVPLQWDLRGHGDTVYTVD